MDCLVSMLWINIDMDTAHSTNWTCSFADLTTLNLNRILRTNSTFLSLQNLKFRKHASISPRETNVVYESFSSHQLDPLTS